MFLLTWGTIWVSQKFCNILITWGPSRMSQMFCNILVTHVGWIENLQSFGNMKYNSSTLNAFAAILKEMNDTILRNDKLTWYSPTITHQICIYSLKHGLGIHILRPTRFCRIVAGLSTRAKFLFNEQWRSTTSRVKFCRTFICEAMHNVSAHQITTY